MQDAQLSRELFLQACNGAQLFLTDNVCSDSRLSMLPVDIPGLLIILPQYNFSGHNHINVRIAVQDAHVSRYVRNLALFFGFFSSAKDGSSCNPIIASSCPQL